jgi:hypothetical protein
MSKRFEVIRRDSMWHVVDSEQDDLSVEVYYCFSAAQSSCDDLNEEEEEL